MQSPPAVRHWYDASVKLIEKKRDRMWTFIFLYILGLNICQTAGEENSTQMHYVKLIIDDSVLKANESLLKSHFDLKISVTLNVPEMTTECQTLSANSQCHCRNGYKWSSDICQSEGCCGQSNCTFKINNNPMCVAESSVNIAGSVNLPVETYKDCLSDQNTQPYKQCHETLLIEMKKWYSTLTGFDSLTINRFRFGSIIAEFTTTIVSLVNSKDLISRSLKLCEELEASMRLETRGVVTLTRPNDIVPYNGQAQLTCTTEEDLGTYPEWLLEKPDKTRFKITKGTEADVINVEKISNITLKNVSELWTGEYRCVYSQESGSATVIHIASSTIDISLLPNIEAYTTPSFPRCQSEKDFVQVKAVCEIQDSTETYSVSWSCDDCKKENSSREEKRLYTAEKLIKCSDKGNITKEPLSCTFENRCGQNKKANVAINIIYAGEKYCPSDGDWEDTKSGHTAQLKCKNMAGQRKRDCSTKGIWQKEESECVNPDLDSVFKDALIVDIGRGVLDDNVASVFSRLQNVTDNSENVNSFSNIQKSVSVFTTFSKKFNNTSVNISDESTNNFLKSSDNLLDKSLEDAWKSKTSDLPDEYLQSVEELIKIANVTSDTRKSNIEVDVCPDTLNNCGTDVSNVTINFKGSSKGTLKTAGFNHIHSYLENNNTEYDPNSIVVSATTEGEKEGVEITIDFTLLNPRPRNVKIICVSRKNNQWSEDGCKWMGPAHEQRCFCTHLSSFAILMSKFPLDLPYTSEITLAGVSVSIASLVLSLLIELIVWSSVVKTNTLYLRHTAHINISLCLIVADCCFLASAEPKKLSDTWCSTVVVVKHFCYLSMFFWMLCLSSTLLHQAVFLFHKVSKKYYLRFSLILGYVCPFLIVLVTFLTNSAGMKDLYYSRETCWLVYKGSFKGSIHTFLIPIGVIVFFNIFSMVVVIMKLLDHNKVEKSHEKEKTAAKTIVRTVILLTPIFGVTWMLGFGVMLIDLTEGMTAKVINYSFVLLNSFQGLFIFLTTCLGDKMTRVALLNFIRKKAPVSTSDSTMKTDQTMKK